MQAQIFSVMFTSLSFTPATFDALKLPEMRKYDITQQGTQSLAQFQRLPYNAHGTPFRERTYPKVRKRLRTVYKSSI